MDAQTLNSRYRLFLLGLAGFIFAGVPFELWAAEHTSEPAQYIPFVLSGLALVAVIAALLRPSRRTLLALRWIMVPVALGSLLGLYLHLTGNIAFAREIQPNASTMTVLQEALHGADPLLAPGVLAIGAVIAAAATYYHPALSASTVDK